MGALAGLASATTSASGTLENFGDDDAPENVNISTPIYIGIGLSARMDIGIGMSTRIDTGAQTYNRIDTGTTLLNRMDTGISLSTPI